MIQFVRIHAENDDEPAGLQQAVNCGALQLLQIDYSRPRRPPLVADSTSELPELAASFTGSLPKFCSQLFLEPEFRIVTSAGWGNSYAAVEHVGRELVAGGSPDLAISAVRGSNLMGILEFLVADGLKLDNAVTGAPWETLRDPVLTADLQLGAGPFTTALAEGARVIVAGCYDGAAPVMAAAVQAMGWSWNDLHRLADAAAAARAAIWPHRHACSSLATLAALPSSASYPRVELDPRGGFTVDLGHDCEPSDAKELLAWLQAGKANDPAHLHADVRIDASDAHVSRTGSTQLKVEGCRGIRTDQSWRLDVLYQAGFVAETMIEFSAGAASALRHQVMQAFQSHFVDANDEQSLVTSQELAGAGEDSTTWLHMTCRSKQINACLEFVDHVVRLAAANRSLVRLPTGRPTVHVDCGHWPARVPRNAVDIAVDTRPAKEWQ